MNDYTIGSICAITQSFIGYPLDTFKVRFQAETNSKSNALFRGISLPTLCSIVTTGINYGIYDDCQNYWNNAWVSGCISGAILSPIVNVGENYKIKRQLGQNIALKDLNITRGLGLCSVRDSIGCSIYFGMYFNLPDELGAFNKGGLAGAASWLFTYPLDTIKTRIQGSDFETIESAIKKQKLFRGLSFCLGRAFLVNACSFFVYDYLKLNYS